MAMPVSDQLRLSDFDYDLPESLIAQEPSPVRDRSRLMVLRQGATGIEHRIFAEIGDYFVPGDVLVLNDTKVFPCRLAARKPGGGKAEIFLLHEQGLNLWRALVRGGATKGRKLMLDQNIEAEIVDTGEDGTKTVRFHGIPDIREALPHLGRTPLPPYIKRDPAAADRERYQTVYALREGAVAAPTAGLHFTRVLLERLASTGVESAVITLHVGPGTFQPVRAELIAEHRMLPERYEISADTAAAVNRAKSEGRRIIAVGTTSVRALETATDESGTVIPGEGISDLFIVPGHRFRIIDGMVTNFHLPKSTLLMLAAALAGRDRMLSAYRTAVRERYRFYSYGDAMLII